ncbi:protein FAM177A1 isoform X2 [Parus major]|uniref:protein FAM177A1 isoform X2 n=1 Tax=Parus major TaxID=9157 RepID=UPI001443AB8E|nr:protein FAM177A1 isoform X2 [Parus major]
MSWRCFCVSRIAAGFAYTFTLAGHFPYPLPKIYSNWLFVSLPNLSFWPDRQFLAALICRDYAWKAPKSSSLCTCILRLYQTTLTWGPYLWFHMLRVATSTLSVCDFLGEKIASVLGISTPKYQYAIDEYYRMKREEEEEEQENKMSEEAERQHQEQQNKPQAEAPVQTDQPGATACSSFVNVNFENEGDCPPIAENKQDVVPVPP